MAWLSSWVKEILVVVLIATFADMLLPNKSMQRYVKTVIGLFLLMLLLSPVLRLFRMDWDTDKLLRSLQQQTSLVVQPAIGQTSPSATLDAVRQEAERLKALGSASAQKLVEQKLAGSIREEIAARFGQRPAAVEVATALDAQGVLNVASVRVTLAAADRSLPAWVQIEPVQPIDPVRPIAPLAGQAEAASKPVAAPEAGDGNKSSGAIADYIAATWEVDPERIQVIRDEAP
ncbi:stage III sporulation protein AF [Gorillibacterium sp. sgz500922]|uniref:stage III sporulation protein AF n=1 Tax=Gorillibacterium sp. sgz500922 TaxID=3446694 RepID=UPI003F66C8BE